MKARYKPYIKFLKFIFGISAASVGLSAGILPASALVCPPGQSLYYYQNGNQQVSYCSPDNPNLSSGSYTGVFDFNSRKFASAWLSGLGGMPDVGQNFYNWADPNGAYSEDTNHLGMYVTPDNFGNGFAIGGGGFNLHNSGVSISDSAGLLAPGANSTSFRQTAGSGGIGGSFNASSLTGPGQRLIFDGNFDFTSARTSYAGGGGLSSDSYGFRGSALYSNYLSYLKLAGGFQFGDNSETSVDGSSGNFGANGYKVDAQLGHVFALFNTIISAPQARSTKSPVPVSDAYAIGLDVSGHIGYARDQTLGFTDTSGFTFGQQRAQGGITGLNATLFASVPSRGYLLEPYVAGFVDWHFDYSHIASFPIQAALTTGDVVRFSDATTFLGLQGGLNVKATNGWVVGVNGFYSRSADTDVVGGRIFLKIPIGAPTVVARY